MQVCLVTVKESGNEFTVPEESIRLQIHAREKFANFSLFFPPFFSLKPKTNAESKILNNYNYNYYNNNNYNYYNN